jgi:anti-sigma regulatory factor (Ser/Thr protein kinase)
MAVQERAWSMVVPHHAGGARQARQRLAAELHGLIPPALLADCVAVAAELLGNAVRHGAPLPGGVIRIACHLGVWQPSGVWQASGVWQPSEVSQPSGVWQSSEVSQPTGGSQRIRSTEPGGAVVELRVSDGGSPFVPTERRAEPDSVNGRGLAIVTALARSWGVEREADGQCVWAELRSPAVASQRPRLRGEGPTTGTGA